MNKFKGIDPRVLGIWLFQMPSTFDSINNEEKAWVNKLPTAKGVQYHSSRSCIRQALSELYGLEPLKIPVLAPPNKPPELAKGWGYISLSHCKDALIVCWSANNVGIDIERSDRKFSSEKIANRYFCDSEKEQLKTLSQVEKNYNILEKWIVKEASIKWQKGKISENLSQWEWQKDQSLAYNHSSKKTVNIYQSNYKDWIFAVAYNKTNHVYNPVVCIH